MFSKRAVIFEDSYEGSPGVTNLANSTEVSLVCSAFCGHQRAIVTFSMENMNKLKFINGRTLPYTCVLEPNERICFTNQYSAVSESMVERDVEASATYYEVGTGRLNDSHDEITIIRLELRPEVIARQNSCLNRHKFGVGERCELIFNPKLTQTMVLPMAGSVTNLNNKYFYDCPLTSAISPVKVVHQDVEYFPCVTIVEPQGVVAEDISFCADDAQAGFACGIALVMDLIAMPLDVSFQRICIEEVPSTNGVLIGYFNNPLFERERCHDREHGAGVWHVVDGYNRFLVGDTAGFVPCIFLCVDGSGSLTNSNTGRWTDGEIMWDVPCGWASLDADETTAPIGVFAETEKQRMGIEACGNTSVRKHGNYLRRLVDGRVYLNGVLQ